MTVIDCYFHSSAIGSNLDATMAARLDHAMRRQRIRRQFALAVVLDWTKRQANSVVDVLRLDCDLATLNVRLRLPVF